jgi:hypothetical protein
MVWDVGHAFDMPRKHDAVSFWVDLVSLRGIQDIRSLSGASIPEIVGKCVKTVAFAGASAKYRLLDTFGVPTGFQKKQAMIIWDMAIIQVFVQSGSLGKEPATGKSIFARFLCRSG